jgi:NADPH2:quinone reductase
MSIAHFLMLLSLSGAYGQAPTGKNRAFVAHEHGDLSKLKVEDVPIPQPKENEVLIRIHAAGVNYVDKYIIEGSFGDDFGKLPLTGGLDGAGEVEAAGSKATRFKKGDRVFIHSHVRTGTFAQYGVFPEGSIFPLPSNISFEQGAAIGVSYFTAYRALFQVKKQKEPKIVLVHGASGGVGSAAVQLAKQAGLTVYGTAGSDAGQKVVKQAGADFVLNHNEKDYAKKIPAGGIDLIIELHAEKNLPKDLELIGTKGTIIIVGSGGEVSIDPGQLVGTEASIAGIFTIKMDEKETAEAGAAIVKGLENGSLIPVIDAKFPLDKVGDAFAELTKDSGRKGKLVIETDK